MSIATFNAEPSMAVSGGMYLHGQADESRRKLTVWLERDSGDRLWGPQEISLGPDPRYIHSDSRSADYLAVDWPIAHSIVLFGWSDAVVLNAATGELRRSFSAHFTGMASLDVADLCLIADGQMLLISSTRRVWVIDATLEPVERLDTIGPLVGTPEVLGNRVILREQDLEDSEGGFVEEELVLPLYPMHSLTARAEFTR
jgi:hypothetical protein